MRIVIGSVVASSIAAVSDGVCRYPRVAVKVGQLTVAEAGRDYDVSIHDEVVPPFPDALFGYHVEGLR